jgi:hypothetical protein
VVALAHERPVRRQRPAIDPTSRASLLGCERDLVALSQNLHRKVVALQSRALDEEVDLRRLWDPFVDRWRDRWTEVGRHCRLDEEVAAQTPALARMAEVHDQLEELATDYRDRLKSFQARYMDRLRELRGALGEVRKLLRARGGGRAHGEEMR